MLQEMAHTAVSHASESNFHGLIVEVVHLLQEGTETLSALIIGV